jgi:hypothetical protein
MRSVVEHEARQRWAVAGRAEALNAEYDRKRGEERLRNSEAQSRAAARSARAHTEAIQQLLASKIGEPALRQGMHKLVEAFVEKFIERAVPALAEGLPEAERREQDAQLALHLLRAASNAAGMPENILPKYLVDAFYRVLEASRQRLEIPEPDTSPLRDGIMRVHQILFWDKREEFHYMHRVSSDMLWRSS